jgi:hypothetical protein
MERMPRGLSHLALVGETSRVGGGNVAKVIDTALAKGGYAGTTGSHGGRVGDHGDRLVLVKIPEMVCLAGRRHG